MIRLRKLVIAGGILLATALMAHAGQRGLGYWTPSYPDSTSYDPCSKRALRCAEWIEDGYVVRACCVEPSMATGGTDPDACVEELWRNNAPRDDIP